MSDRTASLMVNNPDDMGVYNPEIEKWVEVVHEADLAPREGDKGS